MHFPLAQYTYFSEQDSFISSFQRKLRMHLVNNFRNGKWNMSVLGHAQSSSLETKSVNGKIPREKSFGTELYVFSKRLFFIKSLGKRTKLFPDSTLVLIDAWDNLL